METGEAALHGGEAEEGDDEDVDTGYLNTECITA